MDAVRDAIDAGKRLEDHEVGKLNRLVGEVASERDIPFLDLHASLAGHDARNQQRFEFAYGWHCNVLANRLVGEAIARVLLRDPGLSAGSVRWGADAARPPQGGSRRLVSSEFSSARPGFPTTARGRWRPRKDKSP
jgi:hypothetical protein